MYKYIIPVVFLAALFVTGCQPSNQITESTQTGNNNTAKKQSKVPEWYSVSNPFKADSTTFFASSLALNTDSALSINMAKQSALSNLQQGISSFIEQKRRDLVEETANKTLSSSAFIFSLRQAEENIISKAEFKSLELRQDNNKHFCYVGVTISRQEIAETFSNYYSNNNSYRQLIEQFSIFE